MRYMHRRNFFGTLAGMVGASNVGLSRADSLGLGTPALKIGDIVEIDDTLWRDDWYEVYLFSSNFWKVVGFSASRGKWAILGPHQNATLAEEKSALILERMTGAMLIRRVVPLDHFKMFWIR